MNSRIKFTYYLPYWKKEGAPRRNLCICDPRPCSVIQLQYLPKEVNADLFKKSKRLHVSFCSVRQRLEII